MKGFLEQYGLMLCVVCVGIFFRFYHLTSVPPSLSLDEVSIGYNAYSILKTGADEYGAKFPLLLRAYDDFRPALYVYFVVPTVALFGLTPLGVRFPSVILSFVTVMLTFFLCELLFKKRLISLFTTLFLVISPWHIYLSRLSHEVNLGLTLVIFGIYCFFRAIERKQEKFWLVPSIISFALSLNSYQSEKVVVPILVLSLVVLFWRNLMNIKKIFLFSILAGIVILLPLISVNLQPGALMRFQGTSAFLPGERKIKNLQIFLSNYVSHFRPAWLFTGGARENHKVPGLGLLYLWEAPLLGIGIVWLLRSQLHRRLKAFLFFWLATAPLPAAITTQAPHAMRSFTFLPVWQMLGAFGFIWILSMLKQRFRDWILLIFGFIVAGSIGSFWKQYYGVFPQTQSDSFQYALAQTIPYVATHQNQYEKIVFSNQNDLNQSYMFFLFFSHYDPKEYQKRGGTISGGFAQTHIIEKYEFRPIQWTKEKKDNSTLYVGNSADFPDGIASLATFSNLDGTLAIHVVGGK